MDLLKETYRIWAMHREFRTVLAELSSYSDRELTELGLGRGDLARVAYEEAERRILTPATRPSATETRPSDWQEPDPVPAR
jgi:uncharacterized protein YjiS (DUF1127 family)